MVEADHRALDLHLSEQGEELMAVSHGKRLRGAVSVLLLVGACFSSPA
jgi:hypothetical protein